jgi:hypothetical protein
MGYGLDDLEFESRQAKRFSLQQSRPAVGSIQSPVHWVPAFLCGGKVAEA